MDIALLWGFVNKNEIYIDLSKIEIYERFAFRRFAENEHDHTKQPVELLVLFLSLPKAPQMCHKNSTLYDDRSGFGQVISNNTHDIPLYS